MKGIEVAIQKTAEQLNLPEEKVRPIILEYWRTIYYKLIRLESMTISVRNVGIFTISRYKLNNYIKKTIYKIRNTKKSTRLSEEKKNSIIEAMTTKLKIALKMRNKIAISYAKQFKNI